MCVDSKRPKVYECTSIQIDNLKNPEIRESQDVPLPPSAPPVFRMPWAKIEHVLIHCSRQGHESAGAGRGGPNAVDVGQRVAGLHQDVTVRREL